MQGRIHSILLTSTSSEQARTAMEEALKPEECESFDEYIHQLEQRLTRSSCQESWKTPTLVVHCCDCRVNKWTALCLKCFAAGNHEGHSAFMLPTGSGYCDCGGILSLRPEVCCSHHCGEPDKEGHVDELTHDEREKFVCAFQGMLSYLENFWKDEDAWIFDWILELVRVGDAVRRCCVLAVQMEGSLIRLITKAVQVSKGFGMSVANFVAGLLNDIAFSYFYSREILRSCLQIFELDKKELIEAQKIDQSRILKGLFSLSSNSQIVSMLVKSKQIDWYETVFQMLTWAADRIEEDQSYDCYDRFGLERIIGYAQLIASQGLLQNPEMSEQFAQKFFEIMERIESKYGDYRCFDKKYNETDEHERAASVLATFLMRMVAKLPSVPECVLNLLVEKVKREKGEITSVLSPSTVLSPFYVRHLYAFHSGPFFRRSILEALARHGITPEDLVDRPLKWTAVASLAYSNLFVRNPDSFIASAKSYYFKKSRKIRAVPTFAMIQTMLGICHDKQKFLENVGVVFGLFSREACDNDIQTIRNIEQTCLHFVLCLLYDRACMADDKITIIRMFVMSHLMREETLVPKVLALRLGLKAFHSSKFREDFKNYATIDRTRAGSYVKITDPRKWSPLLPFVALPEIFQSMAWFQARNPKELCPFPDFTPATNGIDLLSALKTHFVFGFAFHILYRFVKEGAEAVSNEAMILVLNLVVSLSRMFDGLTEPTEETMCFETMASLLHEMPMSLAAKVVYQDGEPTSIIELVEKCGEMGKIALRKMNLAPPEQTEGSTARDEARRRAMALKQSILGNFRNQQNAIAGELDDFEEEEDEMECSVCHVKKPDEPMVFPCFAFTTVVPDLVRERANPGHTPTKTVGFHVCTHAFHRSCVRARGGFQCPIDRCFRNCLLPKSDSREKTHDLVRCDNEFLFLAFADESYEKVAIRALAGEITLMDARSLLRPESLDKPGCQDMCHYIFMVLWRSRTPSYEHNIEDPTETLIFQLLSQEEFPDNIETYQSLVKDISSTPSTEVQLWEFLRRAAIIQHFILRLRLSEENSIDWDDILSYPSLLKRYNIQLERPNLDLELPLFKLCDLPTHFVQFILPPYDCDISGTKTKYGICLLTGKFVNLGMTQQSSPYPDVRDHLKNELSGGFSLILELTGRTPGAIQGVFASQPLNTSNLRGFYADDFGDDEGAWRGELTHLSRENLDMTIESLLSSEWTDAVKEEPLSFLNF